MPFFGKNNNKFPILLILACFLALTPNNLGLRLWRQKS
jgi:hypothetical protein